MKATLFWIFVFVNFVSCVNKDKVDSEDIPLNKELINKIQQLNKDLKKYHSIDILHKDIKSQEDYIDFLDSLNYFVNGNYFVKSKSAYVKSKSDTITLSDIFFANALLSGNSKIPNKKLILTYQNKTDTVKYNSEWDLYSFKIKPTKKGINKYRGTIYEGDKEYMFWCQFFVK